MLIEVREFCRRVEADLAGLIDELQDLTGRYGQQERRAWERSLPKLSVMLARPQLASLHLHLGESAGMAIEYRLPASSSWCDAVLLGRGQETPAVVIIEMKDWDTAGDRPGPRESLIEHRGSLVLHPSDQVRGYTEYCQLFHSAVLADQAAVAGCVYFTQSAELEPYRGGPHAALATHYPLFSNKPADVEGGLVPFIASRLTTPDRDFAERFERGSYQQDRNLIQQVSTAIRQSTSPAFVLLDEQRRGFEECMRAIDRLLASADPTEKLAVIIEGPPGSGKSVIAAQLWAALAGDPRIGGPIVVTTTTGCQKSNWKALFKSTGKAAAKGIVKGANAYNPGLHGGQVNADRLVGDVITIKSWRQNLQHHVAQGRENKAPDNSYAVSIVDEAHALIDPTAPNAEGVPPSGWSMHAGPQAWHIIRASRVSIFLMDGEQSYRDNETTTRDRIIDYAREQGVAEVEVISLADQQFRCGGSAEYVRWMEDTLQLGPPDRPTNLSWRLSAASPKGRFLFEVVDSPLDLDEALRGHIAEGRSACLVANYARKWKTKKILRPHSVAPEEMDFHIPLPGTSPVRHWSRIWNHAPDEDYSLFIQRPAGTAIHADPLCEVGCPYVVRGFDFDYLGLLWLGDLVRRGNEWQHQLPHIHESAWKKTIAAAKKKGRRMPAPEAIDKLVHRLKRGYRILLSRAVRGVYVWAEDAETRDYLRSRLQG
jgi:hypothetical protein